MSGQERKLWRSLDEAADTPEFRERLANEFPQFASEWTEGLDRRQFLQLASASLALAGLTACTRQPLERIVPYVRQPEEIIPGRPVFYASAATLAGYAVGVIVESHEGRPTKIEGNPAHPASLGGTDAFRQASILGLYDPDRSQVVTHLATIQTWAAWTRALKERLPAIEATKGAGLRILTGAVTSPTLAAQIKALLARWPSAKWASWEAASQNAARRGARIAFGEPLDVVLDFARADVIVALEADLLTQGPGAVRYARDFASRRRVRQQDSAINRMYAAESAPTPTGTQADHRLPVRSGMIPALALALAKRVGVAEAAGPAGPPDVAPGLDERQTRFLDAAAADLLANRGRSLVVVGEAALPTVHALVYAINARLGNLGTTMRLIDPVDANPEDAITALGELTADMNAGQVDHLLILGGNPVFDAPANLTFASALAKVPFRAHLGLETNETSEFCHWHLPMAHELESWGDARAFDGTAAIVQPLIEPLYDGKSPIEILAMLLEESPRSGYEIVREHWRAARPGADFEPIWRRALHDGLVSGSTSVARDLRPMPVEIRGAAEAVAQMASRADEGFELVFAPDPAVHDGRFANNGWLQEMPRPLTTVTWDNPILISPATAAELGVGSGDEVEISAEERTLKAPVWILPGHADRSLTAHFGNGRRRTGRVGTGAGYDAYALRTMGTLWRSPGVQVRRTGTQRPLAATQEHFAMEGRALVRGGTLADYRRDPGFASGGEAGGEGALGSAGGRPRGLLPGFKYEGHAWGLSVDLNACIGCNACVVACQAENNIPVVGKDQVMKGREMHWIRVDRYFEGEPADPEIHSQPVMCMHCEQAPCEVVCPVGATNHSSEGLNDMVYNRCVGTRYCSNNCPYKVRRFNFFLYSDFETPVLKLLRNPNVTVRSRGVMEKCTYCVQRINAVRIEAEKEDRPIRDGEIVTACQQACPSRAIVFGDINDPDSEIRSLKSEPTHYTLLDSLDTRPRTGYLAKVRNPNPDLEKA